MKITDIQWEKGKKYKCTDSDGNSRILTVGEVVWHNNYRQGPIVGHILYSKSDLDITKIYLTEEIVKMEFEEVDEDEQKYYLRLYKPYAAEYINYLNFSTIAKGRIVLSTQEDTEEWKTKFTKTEIKALIDKFGADIMDFERIPVED